MEPPSKIESFNSAPGWCFTAINILSFFVITIGMLALIGWQFDIFSLSHIRNIWPAIAPNSALCFIFEGITLLLLNNNPSKKLTPQILTIVVILIATLTLFEYFTGINLKIDNLLFKKIQFNTGDHPYPNRMYFIAAVNHTLIGISLLLISLRSLKSWLFQILILVVFLSALFVLLGYLYQVSAFYKVGKIAFHAALSFICISIAALLAKPNIGITSVLTQNKVGGMFLRNTILFIIIIPIILGYIRFIGQQENALSFGFNLAIIVLSFIVIFASLAWANAWVMNKQTEKLVQTDERLELALNASGSGIWFWDMINNTITWDKQMRRLFDVKPNFNPKNYETVLKLIDPEDRENFDDAVKKAILTNSEYDASFRIIYADNSVHYIGGRGKLFLDDSGKPTHMTGVCWDMTTQRLAEEQTKKAKEIAEETSRLKSSFMAKISHDLRSPLNGIIGFAELMYHGKVGPVSSEHKEYLGDILTSARQLLLLINDVLDISKVESGKMEFHLEKVNLEKILSETKDIFNTLSSSKNIQVKTSIDPSVQEIKIDPIRFKQVLYNYVSNALKCTPEGGHVTIKIYSDLKNMLHLEVEDDGIGIREEDLSRLFVEFQQLDIETAKKYPSSGLGLALTKHIVEAQGGHVGVRSTFGKGSTFYAILPYIRQ